MSSSVKNETLDYQSFNSSLTEWQKSELSEMDSRLGAQCLLQMWLNYNNSKNEGFCKSEWDYVYCWPSTPPGTVISKPCSEIFQEIRPQYAAHLEGNGVRKCEINGTWLPESQGDYEECETSFRLYIKHISILCEVILVLFLYSTFASVSWMFNQGLYLNITLMAGVVPTNTRYNLRIYYIIGWVVPVPFIFVYVLVMLLKKQEKCWEGYSEMKEMWILLGPVTFQLVINGIFLLNILRILLRKVRTSNARQDSSQLKAAAKATAILFPVLGINNLILLHNPGGDYNKYFVTLNTFFGSTQGIFVAIVYCFSNKDVLAAIHRWMQRANARRIGNGSYGPTNQRRRGHEIRMAVSSFYRRHSVQSNPSNLEQSV